ncbi:glycosyltransferase family 4 protein [Cytobacillus oceanisediminis]|uniref:glycosyltransferase family 4 protein n=1 Tax=Cytobacillus oceanisediminis TaxID=665099 RepID=UPI0020792917|nr:glycosyltransferase family 4 protein [Cytobacillus oceanisediminis]USK43970.1 glycosyltransferase family 4 protein [Cytobacillus oceanisediminis]
MEKKKVLFVATVVKAHIMVFHIPFLKWYKENGYETAVCAKNDYENKEDCVVPYCDNYYNLPFERSPIKYNNFKTYKQLKDIIDSNEFDIIHCHTPVGGALTRLAAKDARKKSTNVIYTAHGFHFYKGAPFLNWLIYYPVEKWLSRYTDILLTLNKEDYKRAKKFKANIIEYIPGVGLDNKRFNDIEVDKNEKKAEIGVKKDSFIILSVGELNKNKNHEVIIKAIAKIKNRNIKYIICGQGPLESQLKELAQELGIAEQLILMGYRNDIDEICKASDLFAFPSFREGLSLSLMEAMAAGLPVVGSDIRGNSDLVDNGKGGYLISPEDVNGYSKNIKAIMNDQQLSEKMAMENKNRIKDFYIESVLKKYSGIITKIIKAGSK